MQKIITKLAIIAALLLLVTTAHAAGTAINETGEFPDASAILDVRSLTRGFLLPRMTAAQRTAIATTPSAAGLQVYQTDGTAGLYVYNGAAWNLIANASGTGYTLLGGNVGIGTATPQAKLEVDGYVLINNAAAPGFYGQSAGINKVYLGYDGAGTGLELYNFTSTKSLMVQDNGYLTYPGNVGIGTTAPAGVLQVNSSSTGTDGKVIISSPSNNFSQFQIGNPSGTEASMQFIPGVTSFGSSPASSYTTNAIWVIGAGIYGIGSTVFGIGNFGAGGSILNIKSTGNVGIGTTTPSQKLDVAGNIKITNQSGPVAAPDKIDLGTSYSNGATKDKLKIYLYDAGGTQNLDLVLVEMLIFNIIPI